MPLYEYRCAKCGKTFEVLQKFSDEPLATHENCGGAVERLISAPTFQFKGSGWYVTDYAKHSSSSPSHEHSDKNAAKAETKTETKKDSAPPPAESKPATSTPKSD